MEDLFTSAIERNSTFLKTVFSWRFWRDAAVGAVIAGFAKAVHGFLKTTISVFWNYVAKSLGSLFQRDKYDKDTSDADEYFDGTSDDDSYDEDDYDGVDPLFDEDIDDGEEEEDFIQSPKPRGDRKLVPIQDIKLKPLAKGPQSSRKTGKMSKSLDKLPKGPTRDGSPKDYIDSNEFFNSVIDVTPNSGNIRNPNEYKSPMAKSIANNPKYQGHQYDGAMSLIDNL